MSGTADLRPAQTPLVAWSSGSSAPAVDVPVKASSVVDSVAPAGPPTSEPAPCAGSFSRPIDLSGLPSLEPSEVTFALVSCGSVMPAIYPAGSGDSRRRCTFGDGRFAGAPKQHAS